MTPKSHRHIRAHSTGCTVEDLTPSPSGDDIPIAWNDRRFFSTDIAPLHRRHDREEGERDSAGHRIYAER